MLQRVGELGGGEAAGVTEVGDDVFVPAEADGGGTLDVADVEEDGVAFDAGGVNGNEAMTTVGDHETGGEITFSALCGYEVETVGGEGDAELVALDDG